MSRIFSAVLMIIVLVFGIFIGLRIKGGGGSDTAGRQTKVSDAYRLIKSVYVDPVNDDSLSGAGIRGMAESLDPHSLYLEPDKAAYTNAQFEGNFDGIGIEFDVVHDTLLVVTPLAGGPSEAAGIIPGDRIVAIDSMNAVGITPGSVLKKLRGARGSQVSLKVYRPVARRMIDFQVTRGKISTSSIDAAFLVDSRTGYIRISQFVATTAAEFRSALQKLRAQGMARLVIDVRGNPGGFLEQAVEVADELLPDRNLIVYTKSRHGGADEMKYVAKGGGLFEKGALCLLVDRGSASAAEILAGALQDNRRGLLVGELTFGKGLVQRQFPFSDGSALRLTVSRYYTPSGRQIQRGYDEGAHGRERYYREMFTRTLPDNFMKKYGGLLYREGPDISVYSTGRISGSEPGDSLKTVLARAGGILPDYWVFGKPYTNLYQELYAKGVFEDIALKLIDDPSSPVQKYRSSSQAYLNEYKGPENLEALVKRGCAAKKIVFSATEFSQDRTFIQRTLRARIGRHLFGTEEQVRVLIDGDPVMKVARHFIEKQAS
ncbi:MAG: S41 family peptidase [Chlorobiaceae bacterium]|nr:S41 family peptidase [Chlorobiaceae bacterium]